MPSVRGCDCLLCINASPLPVLPPIWMALAAQRDVALQLTAATYLATTKDSGGWEEHLAGVRDWQVRFSHLLVEDATAQEVLLATYRGTRRVSLHLRTPRGLFYTGTGTLTSCALTMPYAEIVAYSGTVIGDGPLTGDWTMDNASFHVGVIRASAIAQSSVDVETAATAVVAASTTRQYLLLINASDTDMWLSLGGAATAGAGIPLYANGGSYEMTIVLGNCYAGAITAIHEGSGTKTLLVTEGDLGGA